MVLGSQNFFWCRKSTVVIYELFNASACLCTFLQFSAVKKTHFRHISIYDDIHEISQYLCFSYFLRIWHSGNEQKLYIWSGKSKSCQKTIFIFFLENSILRCNWGFMQCVSNLIIFQLYSVDSNQNEQNVEVVELQQTKKTKFCVY